MHANIIHHIQVYSESATHQTAIDWPQLSPNCALLCIERFKTCRLFRFFGVFAAVFVKLPNAERVAQTN